MCDNGRAEGKRADVQHGCAVSRLTRPALVLEAEALDQFVPRQVFWLSAHPGSDSPSRKQYLQWDMNPILADYSGGPAPDFHRLPFSSDTKTVGTSRRMKYNRLEVQNHSEKTAEVNCRLFLRRCFVASLWPAQLERDFEKFARVWGSKLSTFGIARIAAVKRS